MDTNSMIIFMVVIGAFLPTLIAGARQHRNGKSILICNMIGIFTVIPWFIALVWCFSDNTESKNAPKGA